MAMNFDLSATELLKILGATPSADFERNPKLPDLLNSFLSLAFDMRLFETADIWIDSPAYSSYEDIESFIQEERDCWAADPDKYKDNICYLLSQIPKEQWPGKAAEYLKIGSDYATGSIEFGIRTEDSGQEDPPVYVLFENEAPTGWKLFSDTLSGFLMYILCAVLCCESYDTAREILEDEGWTYEKCQKPENVSATYSFIYGLSACCGFDPDTSTMLTVLSDRKCKAYRISKNKPAG